MNTPAFAGCVVLVTGGAAGLGRGISEHPASRGTTVIIADRDAGGARRQV